MSFKFAKKIKKKNDLLLHSADKETFWTQHPQKTCGVRLHGVQTPLIVHLWYMPELFFTH